MKSVPSASSDGFFKFSSPDSCTASAVAISMQIAKPAVDTAPKDTDVGSLGCAAFKGWSQDATFLASAGGESSCEAVAAGMNTIPGECCKPQ